MSLIFVILFSGICPFRSGILLSGSPEIAFTFQVNKNPVMLGSSKKASLINVFLKFVCIYQLMKYI